MRGAGFNFGIVTAATYQARKLVNECQIMNAGFILRANMTEQYCDVLETFSGKMPAGLAVVSVIYWDSFAQAVSRTSSF